LKIVGIVLWVLEDGTRDVDASRNRSNNCLQ
jgi:hypothetical protein